MRVEVTREQLGAAFEALAQNPAFEESASLVRDGRRPLEMVQAMALRPGMLEAMAALGPAVYPGGSLPRRLSELVIVQVSHANACQFCTDTHVDVMRNLGLSESPVAELQDPQGLPEPEQIALRYVAQVTADANRVDDALFEDLRRHYDDAAIVELTLLVGYINMLNWFNNALGITYHGELRSSEPDHGRDS